MADASVTGAQSAEHDSWSDLHPDLLHEVAKRVEYYADHIRLRAVCKGWNFNLPKFPKEIKNPWLAFVYPDDNPFYSIGEEKSYSFKLSELCGTMIVGAYDGWLVIAGVDGEMRMLNPFTKAQFSLPHMSTFPDVIAYNPEKHDEEYTIIERRTRIGAETLCTKSKSLMQESHIGKVIISSSPSYDEDQSWMAMVIYGYAGNLAYCKFGDKKWTSVTVTDPKPLYRDATYHGGKIYAVNRCAETTEIDIESGERVKVSPPVAVMQDFVGICILAYVVGTPYGLILVIRHVDFHPDFIDGKTLRFDVYKKVNDIEGEWLRVNNLGDYVLMLGFNQSSVCMPHSFSDKKGNRIYYTDDIMQRRFEEDAAGYDVGYFNLEDGTIHQLFPKSLASVHNSDPVPPAPIWLLYKAP